MSGLTENHFRDTLESLLEGCQIIDFDWKYLYLNAAAEAHNRRPNSELLGRTMPQCWPGIEQTDVYQMLGRTLKERISLHQEVEFHFPDGGIGWYDVRCSPVPRGVFVLSLDITERKLHELEALRHQRLYEALSAVNQAIVRIHDRQELFDAICAALVQKAGFKMAWIGWPDASGDTIRPVAVYGDEFDYLSDLVIRTDDSPHGMGPTGRAYKTRTPQVCNDMLQEPSLAAWREKLMHNGFRASAAFAITEGNRVGVLNAYAGEVNFFREKELALLDEAATDVSFALQNFIRDEERRSLEIFAQNENQFAQAMMESMPGIIYFYRDTGLFLRWNRNFELISGYSADEIAQMHPLDFFSEEDKDLVAARIAEVFEHGESSVEASFLTKRGNKIPYYFTGRRIDFAGSPCLIGTGVDISQLKKAQHEVTKLNRDLEKRVVARTAELEAANKELEAFSYSVSHDLRSPLRAINGFAEIVLNKFGQHLPEDGYRYLQRIRNGGHRMGELIDDLLTFSRLSRENLHHSHVDMRKLVQSVVDELAPMAQDRTIRFEIQDLPAGYGDAKLLRQVWLNLIGNAVKYTRHTAQATVVIGSEPGTDGVAYFVRDNGVGFSMAYAHKLFGVFQRLHREDEFEGTGVGLAIVQRVVHRHHGKVWAEAEEGKGAVFWFTLGDCRETV